MHFYTHICALACLLVITYFQHYSQPFSCLLARLKLQSLPLSAHELFIASLFISVSPSLWSHVSPRNTLTLPYPLIPLFALFSAPPSFAILIIHGRGHVNRVVLHFNIWGRCCYTALTQEQWTQFCMERTHCSCVLCMLSYREILLVG